MNNKEAIKLIQGIEEDGRNVTSEHVEALYLAIKVLEADRWIPVSEKLPDKNGKCLVSLDFGDVCLDFYDKDWGFVCYVGNVIAWKPLPKLYESEDNKNETSKPI